jgi:ubiquinone/menaquinone biosynthesis C-methylase UbiE
MRNYKEKVYNSIHGHEKSSYESPYGFIAFLYKNLKKREVNRYQIACNLLPSIRDGKLLNVGCGDGNLIFICRSKFRECYGVDISLARVEHAKKRALERHIDGLYFY